MVCATGLLALAAVPAFYLASRGAALDWLGPATILALIVAALWARHRCPAPDTLFLLESGLWEIAQLQRGQALHLVHAWPAYAWTTLRFQPHEKCGADKTIEVTVWRSCVSAAAWRELHIHVARQAMRPGHLPNREVS
jgi:hypothetical protein